MDLEKALVDPAAVFSTEVDPNQVAPTKQGGVCASWCESGLGFGRQGVL